MLTQSTHTPHSLLSRARFLAVIATAGLGPERCRTRRRSSELQGAEVAGQQLGQHRRQVGHDRQNKG